ncbi:nuclease-related domain-containing protein [Zobellella maritima]|uniref:nuclease-related domain-containing protein n=1 Tax=Zobellella maritima TaxID=2059725 RepID=UPI000E300689|nr:nuclease-related domain-containing protein [Zobellella maritima]
MNGLLSVYFVGVALALLVVPMFILLSIVTYIKKREARSRVSPLTTDLLRVPGFSLQQKIDDMKWDLVECLMMIPVLTAIVPMFVFLQVKMADQTFTLTSWLMVILIIIIGLAYYARKLFKQIKKLGYLRLGYACEIAVGQELEQVVRPADRPYRVFHDIPFEGFNIDHLVVSPKGVFVIETKGRSKPLDNGSKQFKVQVEGDVLHFPRHVEREPIVQTRRNVKAVKTWLSNATGFDVPVAGILVLPGWFVELKQSTVSPYVMNAAQLSKQLPKLYVGQLELGQVQAITHQIIQRVQDVDRERVDRIASRPLKSY